MHSRFSSSYFRQLSRSPTASSGMLSDRPRAMERLADLCLASHLSTRRSAGRASRQSVDTKQTEEYNWKSQLGKREEDNAKKESACRSSPTPAKNMARWHRRCSHANTSDRLLPPSRGTRHTNFRVATKSIRRQRARERAGDNALLARATPPGHLVRCGDGWMNVSIERSGLRLRLQ